MTRLLPESEISLQKLLVAAVAVVVLILGAAVPALALTTQAWEERRIATEAFDAAAGAALDASEEGALATERLAVAREAAEPVLEDARAVASSAPGYFAPAVIDPLAAAVAALDEALADEAPDGIAMPERPWGRRRSRRPSPEPRSRPRATG